MTYEVSLGSPLAVGRTAEIYGWRKGWVLKLFRQGYPQGAAAYEARISRLVYEGGLPVPAVGDVVEIDGRYGFTLERVTGVSMLQSLAAKPWTLGRMARLLAHLQVEMHAMPGVEGLPGQHHRLREKILRTGLLTPDLKEAALRLLESLPAGDRLCHGDFHPENVLMTEKGPVVIDWIDATTGHPLADVARSSLLMAMSPLSDGAPLRLVLRLGRDQFHGAYIRHYFRHCPDDRRDLNAWRVVNAAARLDEGVAEERALLAYVQARLP